MCMGKRSRFRLRKLHVPLDSYPGRASVSSPWETLVIPAPGRRVNKTGVGDLRVFSLLYHLKEVLSSLLRLKFKKRRRQGAEDTEPFNTGHKPVGRKSQMPLPNPGEELLGKSVHYSHSGPV